MPPVELHSLATAAAGGMLMKVSSACPKRREWQEKS